MRIKEAKEAMRRKQKIRQVITGIEGRIVEHYRRNVFLIKGRSGIISQANAGELTLARRKSDGKTK